MAREWITSPTEPGKAPSLPRSTSSQFCHSVQAMKRMRTISNRRTLGITALAALALGMKGLPATAQDFIEVESTKAVVEQRQIQSFRRKAQDSYDAYILGPGDRLEIELLDMPELSGTFSIGPDGTIYFPRVRSLYVEGLTVEEMRNYLTQQLKTYVRDPQLYVRTVAYRPIRIYVGGEVQRPGYYTLSGVNELNTIPVQANNQQSWNSKIAQLSSQRNRLLTGSPIETTSGFGKQFILPTVFDAIRAAQGITPYSDLSKVQVTRKRALGLGGGRIRTNLDFLSLITEGNESQNIRLNDGDVVSVAKSSVVMRDQLLRAGQTNLSPQFMNVFVGGRVKNPGGVVVPQAAVLNQAIIVAGGPKLLRGKVEFIRFTPKGEVDRRIFSYDPTAGADAPNNPVLMAGDLIAIRESPLSAATTVLNEITAPALGIYSLYSIFDSF